MTRSLRDSSPFRQLNDHHIESIGCSFIETNKLEFELPKGFNWIFFSSPTSVQMWFERFSPKDFSSCMIGCIGVGTEESLRKLGIKTQFVGQGNVSTVSSNFAKLISTQDLVLFPQALEGRRSVQQSIDANQVIDLPIYSVDLKKQLLNEQPDLIAFTSPSNVKAYFNSGNQPHSHTIILAIGEATANELQNFGFDAQLSEVPSEESLTQLALAVLSN